MSRVKLILGVLLVLALVQACTPSKIVRGHHLAAEDVDKVQPGVTTQQQVQSLLGSPSSVTTFKQRADTWYYITRETEAYTELDESIVDQVVVAVTFDNEGRVDALKAYGLKDSREIAFVERTTPTQGDSLTLMEQLFQNLFNVTPGAG